ncbi:MAG: maltose alpha-D-glucosyltransferase [Chitinophagaceae bacterium]|nr:maltose alpha-D-glucosyltransferase [Chitinophagaceae bacterium]
MANSTDDRLWYKDAIIYELHIKAFRDSNKDGMGDFEGLLEKLDYLQELGVTAIWLLPFYPSPQKDDGYDISDYYSINPNYGDLDQFKSFLTEAHKRNLKVIIELVINHTSDEHPWFQRARSSPKGSPERNFYVWTDDPNQYNDVRIIFQDFEGSNWTWDPLAQQYYWHRFFHHQPDLNYDSPLVQEEIFKIIDYWCAMGVDAFRLDAVPYLFEREGTNCENLPETHAFLKKLRKYIDERYPGICFLAEANMWPEDSASYFGNGDECHMNYHFPAMPRMFMSLQMEDRYPVADIFDQTPAIPENCQWAIFLRNHDELTLEMVTDEERDFMYKTYAKDPKAKINLGIRHRLAPLMDNNRKKIELMNSLLFSLPGTPVIYYGDEIGMGDNFYLGDRNGVRTPMQWSPDRNAGFSEANPHSLYLPVILDPEYHYEAVNVEMQQRNTSSLFWFMKRMINMRKNYKAFGRGNLKFLHVENSKILAFTRSYQNETLLIVVNLSKFSQPAEVDLRDFEGYLPVEMFSKNCFPAIRGDSPYFFTLGPHSYQWFSLKKIATLTEEQETKLQLQVEAWQDLLIPNIRQQLEESILPVYLPKRKWFKGNQRIAHSFSIINYTHVDLQQQNVFLLLIEVTYESGLPETYQLAVTSVKGRHGKYLADAFPDAVITEIKIGDEIAILCDAFYTPETQEFLIRKMGENAIISVNDGAIRFNGNERLQTHVQKHQFIQSKMHTGDENNTSITYDHMFFLKMYRKVEPQINPDVEMSRYLSDELKFAHAPGFIGTIEWETENGCVVLGIMQVMIENHGDGHMYMVERVNNYIERILARFRHMNTSHLSGTLAQPLSYEELTEDLKVLMGGHATEQARMIGIRTGEMHLALASATQEKDFRPEEFSLHYQRSLYSSLQSLVRATDQNLRKQENDLPPLAKDKVREFLNKKNDLLSLFKRIYSKKIDVIKVRIHGNYSLKRILLTGKDLVISDFGGDTAKGYSERRLKRSALVDVAEMICSLHYAAYEGFFTNNQIPKQESNQLLPFADFWAHYIRGIFLSAYFDTVQSSSIMPREQQDLSILLETFILEKALHNLNTELNNPSEWALVPLRIIQTILK